MDKSEKNDMGSTEEATVKTANSWEKADLGDNARKSKFMRLLGANRYGGGTSFVSAGNLSSTPADKTDEPQPENKRPAPDFKQLEDNLESQYNRSLEFKMSGAQRKKCGLGFSAPILPPTHGATPTAAGSMTSHTDRSPGQTKWCAAEKEENTTDHGQRQRERKDLHRHEDREHKHPTGEDDSHAHDHKHKKHKHHHHKHGHRKSRSRSRDRRKSRDSRSRSPRDRRKSRSKSREHRSRSPRDRRRSGSDRDAPRDGAGDSRNYR